MSASRHAGQRGRPHAGGPAGAMLGLLCLALLGCGRKATPSTAPIVASGPGAPVVGKAAPDFVLRATDGRRISLADQRGSVVLVNFWATWCGPCKRELPAINAVQRKLGPRGFTALGVDYADQDDAVERFAAAQKLDFPLLEDSIGGTASVYRLLGVPTSYLLDSGGVLRAIHAGPYTERELTRAVSAILSAEGH
ncbi:MAG TPA: TlpA disulfide reductase family protein [Dehalococcoidia bacterium]|nr:TlpA disulfide reductase family protein [Dehalococcoidia bacterium]